jgi:hypothetical protein
MGNLKSNLQTKGIVLSPRCFSWAPPICFIGFVCHVQLLLYTMAHKTPTKNNKYWTSINSWNIVFPSGINGAFFYQFCFLPTLQVLFSLYIVYSLVVGTLLPHLVQILSVSKSLLAALKDKGKRPTMLLSGESGSNKNYSLLYYCLIGMDNNFFYKTWDPTPHTRTPNTENVRKKSCHCNKS